MSYEPRVWVNKTTPDGFPPQPGATPIQAEDLNDLEQGLQAAAAVADEAAASAQALDLRVDALEAEAPTGGGGPTSAAQVAFTPTGSIQATTVQAAIAEVASDAAVASSTSGAPNWLANTAYLAGQLVFFGGIIYRRKTDGTSGATFDPAMWDALTSAPAAIIAVSAESIPDRPTNVPAGAALWNSLDGTDPVAKMLDGDIAVGVGS